MPSRREFLHHSARLSLAASAATMSGSAAARDAGGVVVNDAQSQLNATRVRCVLCPKSVDDLQTAVRSAKRRSLAISMAGGRHSMGGQQFGTDNIHLSMNSFKRVLNLDTRRGLVTVQAGIQWPELMAELHRRQPRSESAGSQPPWVIREKQTGVDTVSIGGSLASNIHGRGLAFPPFVHDIDSFDILDANGCVRHCSRRDNPELFRVAIGGYGLFGIVTQVTLRLVRQFKVKRHVEQIVVRDVLDRYQQRRDAGFVFGDCQYSVDLTGDATDHPGIMPCYEPVDDDTPVTENAVALTGEQWAELYRLVRTDKRRAFDVYSGHYQRTNGQVYWSDTHQLAGAFAGHKAAVDPKRGTEVITEVYLSHDNVMPCLTAIHAELSARKTDLSYGTIRFIEADSETFLPWARQRSVCIVCNIHVQHTKAGIARARSDSRAILDQVGKFGGSFFLTYHRWATPSQIRSCYPKIREFFRLKRHYDPEERFQSDWYRHYAPQFA